MQKLSVRFHGWNHSVSPPSVIYYKLWDLNSRPPKPKHSPDTTVAYFNVAYRRRSPDISRFFCGEKCQALQLYRVSNSEFHLSENRQPSTRRHPERRTLSTPLNLRNPAKLRFLQIKSLTRTRIALPPNRFSGNRLNLKMLSRESRESRSIRFSRLRDKKLKTCRRHANTDKTKGPPKRAFECNDRSSTIGHPHQERLQSRNSLRHP